MRSILQAASTGDSSIGTSINFLAGPRRASVAFGDRGLDSSSREHWRFVGSSGIVEYQGSRHRTCCVVSSRFYVGLRFSVSQFFLVIAIA